MNKGLQFHRQAKREIEELCFTIIFSVQLQQKIPFFILNQNLLQIGNIFISFNSIFCLLQDRLDGWLNDEVQDLFINSINLYNGFTSNKFTKNPPLHTVNIFRIIQLFKYDECSPSNQ